jgi:hypothetical protein
MFPTPLIPLLICKQDLDLFRHIVRHPDFFLTEEEMINTFMVLLA